MLTFLGAAVFEFGWIQEEGPAKPRAKMNDKWNPTAKTLDNLTMGRQPVTIRQGWAPGTGMNYT